jgi:hypothetical protein
MQAMILYMKLKYAEGKAALFTPALNTIMK